MKMLKLIIAVLCVLATIASASALPVVVDEVQLDDVTLSQSGSNRIAIDRGEVYEVEVHFTPWEDLRDVEVEAFISGYEFNDVDRVSDHTGVFDADGNVTYVKRLKLKFPDDLDEDSYRLRVVIADRDNFETVLSYSIKVDVPRHAIQVEDVIFSPNGAVKAGSALLASVRVENKGERDEDDLRVTVSIPQLGISGTDYIDEIENGNEEEETEEIFLRIPRCTQAGTYDAIIEVSYSQKHRKETVRKAIDVLADETCGEDSAETRTIITLGASSQDVMPGQTATFPVTMTNGGRSSKTFVLTPQQADWADVTLSPTSTIIVGKGETKTVFVNVAVHEDTPAGAHTISATVSTGEHVQDITMTAKVSENQKSFSGFFEITLAVLLILLIILGIGIGVSKMRDKDTAEYY